MQVTQNEVKATIAAVRALLEREDKWAQGGYGYTSSSIEPVDPEGSDAHQWCLVGAIYRVARAKARYQFDTEPVDRACAAVAQVLGVQPVASDPRRQIRELVAWNDEDGRTHGQVLALLDQAIAA